MSIPQITPSKAKEILDEDPQAVYLDVRSVPEFAQGHAEGAINIPVLHQNEQTGKMIPNPEFTTVAQAVLPNEKTYVVGCKMGMRSQKACELLAGLGYEKLYNIDGGLGGNDREQGWQDLGFPVSTDNGEGVSYESLKSKATG